MSVKSDCFPIKLDDSIILRPYTKNDADVIFRTINENRVHLGRWFPWVTKTQTIDDTHEFLMTVETEQKTCTGLHLGLFKIYEREMETLLGSVAIRKMNVSEHTGEVGCWLASECQGKGLATKACLKLIEYAKTTLGIVRFELQTAVHNLRTQALAGRLNFTVVPNLVLKGAEVIDSKPVDHLVYVLDLESTTT